MVGCRFISQFHKLALNTSFLKKNNSNKIQKIMSYLSYKQLNFKKPETNKSIGFN